MTRPTWSTIAGVAMLVMLAVNTLQIQRRDEQLERLAGKVASMEADRRVLARTAAASVFAAPAGATAEPPAQVTNAPIVQLKQSHGEAASQPTVFDEMTASGSIDPQTWAAFDERIRTMSPQQNKAFWEQMTAAIERGEVVVYNESQ